MNILTARMFRAMDNADGFGTDMKGHMALLYALAMNCGGDVVEIGVNRGNSTLALLAGVTESGSRLVSIDKREECEAAACRTCGISEFHWNWSFVPHDSAEAASLLEDDAYSLLFIDGDHRYQSVCMDLRMYEPKLRAGGILAGHDYRLIPGVERAVKEFMQDRPGEYRLQVFDHDCGLFVLWPLKTSESSG
jgi:predicted O-methyltransferase YrrM